MKKLILKHLLKNGKGTDKLLFASTAPWMEEEKPIISSEVIAKFRKDIADRHAVRAIQERNLKRLNELNNVVIDNTKATAEGEVKDKNKVQIDKALSWYGLSNGFGLMTNVSDKGRNTPSFGDFAGRESLRPIKAGAFLAPIVSAPLTAAFGFINSLIGGELGGRIGKKFGKEKEGEIVGSFIFPTGVSGFTTATRPILQRAFSNNFSDSFGYHQILRIPAMLRDYGRGLIGKGPKTHPIIVSNDDEMSVTAVRNGKNITDKLDYENGIFEYEPDRNLIINTKLKDTNGNPRDPKTFDVQKSIARSQAVAKYAGASDKETPLYMKNKNGSYQYNLEDNPFKVHQMLNSEIKDTGLTAVDEMERAMLEGKPIVTADFLGGNGGNVGLTYQGSFIHNGEPYHRFMMKDLWDLLPIGGLGNALVHMLNRRPTEYTKLTGISNVVSKIGLKFPSLSKVIKKVANNPAINREVGRIVGGKPFMLEHPFAVSEKALRSRKGIDWRMGSMNLFNNKEVPGALYAKSWELPYNLGIKTKNLTYPIFNSWKLQLDLSFGQLQ